VRVQGFHRPVLAARRWIDSTRDLRRVSCPSSSAARAASRIFFEPKAAVARFFGRADHDALDLRRPTRFPWDRRRRRLITP
jgi:hypothetical protein